MSDSDYESLLKSFWYYKLQVEKLEAKIKLIEKTSEQTVQHGVQLERIYLLDLIRKELLECDDAGSVMESILKHRIENNIEFGRNETQ